MANYTSSLIGPVTGLIPLTPSDADMITEELRGFMVDQAGDVHVEMVDGSSAILYGLVVGFPYPFEIRQLRATGTTITSAVGLL